jgi:predicted nucleic acid-binding protein
VAARDAPAARIYPFVDYLSHSYNPILATPGAQSDAGWLAASPFQVACAGCFGEGMSLSGSFAIPNGVSVRELSAGECAYSAITRIELLGFPEISREEESLIRQKLERLTYLPLSRAVEDVTISLRQTRKIKLPDAVIAATALCAGIELLTLDKQLQSLALKTES